MFLERLTKNEKNKLFLKLASYALSVNTNATDFMIESVNKKDNDYYVNASCSIPTNTTLNQRIKGCIVVGDFYSYIGDLLDYDSTVIDNKMTTFLRNFLYKNFGEEYAVKFVEYKNELLNSEFYDL